MSNRDKLLKAARKCLLTIGYERTTVRHLVAASGANQASINYHFGSKEQLLTHVLRDLNREWGDVLFAALSPGAATAGTEAVTPHDAEATWGRIIDSIQANRALWFVNFESISAAYVDDDIRSTIAGGQRLAREALARAFGADEADDAAVGAHYYALLVGVAAQWLIDPEAAPTAAQLSSAARGAD